MTRIFILILLSAFAGQAAGQRGSLDPAFNRIPFDQWLGEREQAHMRWTVSVPHAELSFHQRLMALLDVKVDGRDLESRRGDGELVFFFQITERDGTRYQNHSSVEFSKLDANIKAADLECSERAFLLPGDYRLAVGLLDTKTGEHSVNQLQFRIAAPHNSLPEEWHDLPAVEFIGSEEPPDGWYLPGVQGKVQWASSVRSPVRINVILNVAPSVPVPGSRRTHSSDLAALLPTLKLISQSGSPSLSEHVELLDLARRRAFFHQDEGHELDWARLKASLGEANTASIDVHSLAERHHDAQFFVSRVRGLLRASDKPCVLVVLATPVAFESGEDLAPISLEALPACSVVYVRYREPLPLVNPFERQMAARRSRFGTPPLRSRPVADVIDQLASTLKPLSPRVIDVETPDQMTKALAEIEKAVLNLDARSSR